MEKKDTLKGFEVHGVSFKRSVGNQMLGDCPFCGKREHFYVNKENKLWDCKVCGRKGNFFQFLDQVAKHNIAEFNDKTQKVLAIDRGLPRSAFMGWEVGWNGDSYTIPIRNLDGKLTDLRLYRPGGRAQATSGASLGLLGAPQLAEEGPIYVCEGEWDTFAFRWLLKAKLGKPGIVVGVPGASVFKKEWLPWFQNREVIGMYDNDAAGELGHKKLTDALSGFATSIKCLRWPEGLPQGWDVRDHVKRFALKDKKPKYALRTLLELIGTYTPVSPDPAVAAPVANQPEAPKPLPKIEPAYIEEAAPAYRKWLHLPEDEVLRVLFGAAIANKLQGDPIWLFLVAPPGGSKSELLSSLSKSPRVESTTSLTPHSLVSGAQYTNGVDPSLLPKLNGRILVIKDFTTILSMHYSSRDEIFGVLRDVYDGRTEKVFGTGLKRAYISHFGIIAGVTPKIEEFGVVHQSLGERFLKYRINMGSRNISEGDRIRRALQNINKENDMRNELCVMGSRCLEVPVPEKLPDIPNDIFDYLIDLAQVTAMMRGVVERDRYTQQVIYKPSIEIGTRLAKQLAKLSIGMAIYGRYKIVNWDIYKVIRKVALDTAPDRVEEVVRRLWQLCPTQNDAAKTAEVSAKTRLPTATCFRLLQDLELLKLVDRVGTGNKYEWTISKKLRRLILGSRLFEVDRRKADRE